ncbi:hypothetical protein H7U32_01975 [Bifidobacterium pullorum subsp. saeculare]|uniref:MacB-like periplasmic core domain-containing protein n=1 Tax=Bifidobacterium pullorum subsp. saeculare TaxID=78257 RepID=A0A938WVS2_9BIFI|nr:hypothetical protein [Bifidobacterium pullorum]MBM6699114.1 hypothetical protein [Bifidobacterium pullorum subsp. saeculare]
MRGHGSFGTIVRRDIRATLGRFLAIVGIVALGCGFLAGLTMGGPDMRAAADRYYDGTHLWDLRLVSTLGFSDDDARRVAAVDGVDAVMPSIATDAMARIGGRQQAVRVSLLPEAAAWSHADGDAAVSSDDGDYLNRLILRDGRWPRAADEAVALADAHDDVRIGGTARIGSVAEGGDTSIDGRRLTIVGTVSSPNYPYTVSFGTTTLGTGQLDQVLYVPRDTFGDTPYTELYLTVDGARGEQDSSDGYRNTVDAVADRIRDQVPRLATARRDDLRDQAMAQVEAMRAQLERTTTQLAAAQAAQAAQQQPSPQSAQALQAAQDQAAQAQARIDEATRQAESIAKPDIVVLDRTASESHATYRADSERMDSIAALCQLLPVVVMNAYAIIYAVPPIPFPLPVSPALGALGVMSAAGRSRNGRHVLIRPRIRAADSVTTALDRLQRERGGDQRGDQHDHRSDRGTGLVEHPGHAGLLAGGGGVVAGVLDGLAGHDLGVVAGCGRRGLEVLGHDLAGLAAGDGHAVGLAFGELAGQVDAHGLSLRGLGLCGSGRCIGCDTPRGVANLVPKFCRLP